MTYLIRIQSAAKGVADAALDEDLFPSHVRPFSSEEIFFALRPRQRRREGRWRVSDFDIGAAEARDSPIIPCLPVANLLGKRYILARRRRKAQLATGEKILLGRESSPPLRGWR